MALARYFDGYFSDGDHWIINLSLSDMTTTPEDDILKNFIEIQLLWQIKVRRCVAKKAFPNLAKS